MTKNWIFILALWAFGTQIGQGQQLPQYTHYWANVEAYNPAYSGIMENGGSLSVLYRSQWDQLSGAPETQLVSLILPNYNHRIGVGFNVQHDKLRPQRNLLLNSSIGYQAIKDGETKLTLGASIGLQDRRSELSQLKIINQQDNQFRSDEWRTNFNIGIGAHLYGEKWFLDAFIPNVYSTEVGVNQSGQGGKEAFETVTHYYLGGGLNVNLSDKIAIHPKGQFKFTEEAPNSIELQAPISFNEKFDIGPFIRIDDAVGVIAAVGLLDNQLKLGYAYGASTTRLREYNDGSHELALRYKLSKPTDTDNDGIPDHKDKCVDTPGLKAFDGCPDTDLDGIIDSEDACPTLPGPLELQGCPDTDGDGLTDNIDNCPEEAGPGSTMGCPDLDEDGIIDSEDDCPETPGEVELNGCPDTDKDGIADRHDDCPTEGGEVDDHGCPLPLDSDGDGVIDEEDDCPSVKGALNGCPDTDGDGYRDMDDKCPEEGGDVDEFGCPKPIIPTVQPIGMILFDTDANVIKNEYLDELNKIVEIMTENEAYTIVVDGHTDSVGNANYNEALSKRRAERVQRFLINKGLSKDRVSIAYFGEEVPNQPNDTLEGRKKNRRAEFRIIDGDGNLRYQSQP